MNLKGRMHDYFYRMAYNASGNVLGRFALNAAGPVLRRAFPIEKNTKSPEEVLTGLGYDPHIFENVADMPVRVFTRNLGSMLALSTMVSDQLLLREIFSPRNSAVAMMSPSRLEMQENYIVLNERIGYRQTIAAMSGLDEDDLGDLKGDQHVSLGITLGHEMTHFDLPFAEVGQNALEVRVESQCDYMPLSAFKNASDPETFQNTFDDLLYARAVRPILDSLKDKNKVKDMSFGHATALALDDPDLLKNENIGERTIEAYQQAVAILGERLDWDSMQGRKVEIYRAALSALENEDFSNNLSRRAIELFAQGMEHLAPDLLEQANLGLEKHSLIPG